MEQWLNGHHAALIAEIGVVWLTIVKFLTAFQDAVNAEPKDLKPPFGKIIYYMSAIGGYLFMGNRAQSIKNTVAILILFIALSCSSAQADIFNPLPGNPKYKTFLNSVNSTSINGNLLNDFTQIINYLGAKEGQAYNFNQRKWVTTTGATIISYTPWNLALDADMLNTDGFGGSIDWNVGNYLPVQNVPVMQYTQYLSVFGGAGAEDDSNGNMKFASYLGVQFKFSFGASS